MKLEVAKNINEFLNIIHKTDYFNNNWFRGHRDAHFRLEPSLYRGKKEVITGAGRIQLRHYELNDENLAIKEFKKRVSSSYANYNLSDIDYLYMMQHHGIETRLLDFSTNPLIALFFSVAESKRTENQFKKSHYSQKLDEFAEDCSSVFCINPKTINKVSFGKEKIIDLSYVKFKDIQNLLTPVCIEPTDNSISTRLKTQNGKFVLFGSEVNPLDWYDVPRQTMLKILIPNSKRERILFNLDKKFDINYTTVYPDIEGIKLYVKRKVENNYKKL